MTTAAVRMGFNADDSVAWEERQPEKHARAVQARHVIALREMLGPATGDFLSMRIAGDCMAPHLVHGQPVVVRRMSWCWPGDVLVFFSPLSDRLIAHRLIGGYWRNSGWRLLTQADKATTPDLALRPEQVLGRIIAPSVPRKQRLAAILRFLAFAWRRLRHP